MIKKRTKSILSLILTLLIILPSFSVDAIENQQVVPENHKEQNVDKQQKEEYKVEEKAPTSSFEKKVYEREEFNLKQDTFDDSKYLKTKTSSKYEIALAYSDGSYSYLDKAKTLEEAIKKVDNTANTRSEEEVQPVVVDERGQVVYSRNSMAAIIKHVNGQVYPHFDKTTNIYSDSSLKNAYTYINHGYIEDAPIIQDKGKVARVQVAGYTGWLNKDTNSKEYEMTVVPTNQVTNPSYYKVENGVLKHFISVDLRAHYQNGNTITLGVAPSYLKEGVRYLSYDGIYFYDGKNITNGLNNLISDLKNENKNNAINKDNPNYTYFNYLPFRSKTKYTAEEIDRFINENTKSNSKLRGIGKYLIEAQNEYGSNALLTLAIAINESGWGTSSISQSKNNIFGINAVDSNPGQAANYFNSVADCINEFTKNYISRGYSDPADWRYNGGFVGNKSVGANVKYASDPFWGEKATQYAFKIDYYLSGENVNNLKDNNEYQLAIFTGPNEVRKDNDSLLYRVTSNPSDYSGRIGTSIVLKNSNEVSKDSGICYEVYPERDTPVNGGGSSNEFQGNYNWNDPAYIKTSGVQLINSSNSKQGWKQDSNGKWYYYENGNLHKGWLQDADKWYYLDGKTGEMATGWAEVLGKWYYFNRSGVMQTHWLEDKGEWYYLKPSGEMATGWAEVLGKRYYFNNSGVMQTHWLQDADKWYYLKPSGEMATGWAEVLGKWYYFNNSGVMQTHWLQDKGYWYYLKPSGEMATGWAEVLGKWYYFNNSGAMHTGWLKDGDSSYYLKDSGEMVTGKVNIDGVWYYFKENGALQSDKKVS